MTIDPPKRPPSRADLSISLFVSLNYQPAEVHGPATAPPYSRKGLKGPYPHPYAKMFHVKHSVDRDPLLLNLL